MAPTMCRLRVNTVVWEYLPKHHWDVSSTCQLYYIEGSLVQRQTWESTPSAMYLLKSEKLVTKP